MSTPVVTIPPVGDVQVNSFTTGLQLLPSVATLPDGGWVVSWTSGNQDGDGFGVYAQRYDAAGVAVGAEVLVNTHTADNQQISTVETLSGGGWIVSWTSGNQDGDGFGTYLQRYNSAGVAVGGEVQVNTFTTSDQFLTKMAALPDGGWIVTWTSVGQDGDFGGVYQQRYDAAGAAVGAEVQVNTETASNQDASSVAALSDGGWVVTWQSFAQDGDSSGIYTQRYDSAGVAVGGEVQVNTTVAGSQRLPSVTALPDGGFVMSWTSVSQEELGGDVYLQRYDVSGAAVGGEVRVNTQTSGDQSFSSVAALADGSFVVSWTSAGQDGDGGGIFLQRYDADGVAVGGEVQVNTTTAGNQFQTTVAALGDGGFVISWSSDGQDGNSYGVFQKVFNADGSERPGAVYVENAAAIAVAPGLAVTDADSTLLAGATVTVTDYVAGEDLLSFADQGGIKGSWDPVSGTLVLTGSATLGLYEAALRSVTYTNTSDAPTGTGRTIAFQVDDGAATDNLSAPVNAQVTIIAVNDAPVVSTPLADQASAEDAAVSFVLPADSFADVDGSALTLTAELSDGSALPAWLSFDAAARSFTGTPPFDFNGVLDVRVRASDGVLEVSDSFALTITPVNDAPVVSVSLLDQASAEDAAVNFVLPAGSFTDVDGDTLTLAAVQSDGSALPAWLSFDAAARSFTGTPPLDFNGVLDVRVTASDGALEVSDTFALAVTPVNDAPVVSTPLTDQASAEDAAVSFILPAGSFTDVDGDALTLSAELSDGSALPAWLSFDAAGRSFTGTPPLDFNGVLDIRVTASDSALEVSDSFALTITPENDAPVVSTPLADQTSAEDAAVSFALPAGSFTDVDGDTLALAAELSDGSVLPAWLSFDAVSRSFTGTPPLDFNGVLDVRVTASDGVLEVSDTFTLTITPVNDAPIVSTPLADQASAEDTAVSFVLPAGTFTDVDGDTLTLTAALSDGSALPAWLSFDAGTRSFTGTPPLDFNGVLDVRVTASDGAQEVGDTFALAITPVNDAPVVSTPLADQASTEDTAVNFVLPAGSFTDVDGDALILTVELSDGSALPAWLSFDAAARSFTGTPPLDFNGVMDIRVTASDGALEVDDTFALAITPVNDAPIVNTPLADQASAEDTAVSFVLPAGTFTDVDGDALTLTAALSDGTALPAWLNFDAATRSFTGTPPLEFNGALDVRVTASDGALEVSDTFVLAVTPVNDAPIVSTPLADQASAEDTAVSFVLPAGSFTDVDGDALILTAGLSDGEALPAWLNFDSGTRSFTGTPPLDFNGVLDVRVIASDGALEVNDTFALTITPVNDAPIVSTPLADQASAEDAAVSFVLPAGTFTDVDGDTLTPTAELSDGEALPAWLNFDSGTRSFTGTPPLDFNGVLDIRVTASDGALEVNDTFTLTITPVNDAPVVSTPLVDQAFEEDTAVNFVLPAGTFTEVDGDALTLTVELFDGAALPVWLSFDAAARSFKGTPPSDFNGVLDVRVTASDGALDVSDTFTLTITPVNDVPVVSAPLTDQASAEDAAVSFILPADSFTDVDGNVLTLAAGLSDGSALPAWLSFDAAARSFTGTPPLNFNGVLDVRVTASDGALEVNDTFTLTITPVNDAPVVSTPLADQASAEDIAVNFALPAGSFTDVDGDALTLTVELSDGAALPVWLSFDAAARSFTGTPPSDFNGVLDVRVTASDGALEVSDTFTLTITPVNDAPVVSTPLTNQASAEDAAVNFVLPAGAFTDVDDNALTLTAELSDGSALPAWLSFDAAARSITGTPPLDFNGVLDVRVTASDGTLEVSDTFALTVTPVNDAPVVSAPLADKAFATGTAVNFALPAGSFTDVDGDTLTLTATLSDGTALPAWLSFDAVARSFTGTPPLDFDGVLDVQVTASDGALEVNDTFAITVDDAPVVSLPLADQAFAEDTAVNFVLPVNSFTDVDGDALTLTATLSDGMALPVWLSFDAVARSFTGTPPLDFNGVLDVRVTASDGALEVSDTFTLTITPVNDAPVVSTPLADQASAEDIAVNFALPAGAFADVDGDALTLTAELSDGTGLPAWLSFDAVSRSFTGTPPLDFNGVLDVRVTASDGVLEASDSFALTITPVNDAPVVSTPLADQASAEDTAVNFVLPAGTFTDVDGDALTLTAALSDGTALPAWLSFDAVARSFTGTPPLDFNGALDVRVTTSDGALEVSDTFALAITPVNDAPVVSTPLADQASTEDTAVNFVLPAGSFTDVDGDALILTAELSDGSALPAWLSFDAAARSFTGNPPLDFNGVLDVRVTASDGALDVSDTFALAITPVNDAPVVSSPLVDQTSAEDAAVSFVLPAGTFADVDGDALTLTAALSDGTALPVWLSFDAVARSFTGTPPLDFNGVLDVRVTASDGALEVNDTFALAITPVNDAPVVSTPLADQASIEDTVVNFVLPAGSFTDVDGDALTLTAELSDGSALPAWLSFDAAARSFTGIPPLDFNGVLDVRVTASDGALDVSDTFALTVTPANDAPVVSTPLVDQASAEDTAVNFVLPAGTFTDVDGDALTLTAELSDGSVLPAWLSFDAAARSFTGTPPLDFNGLLDVRVTASDGVLEVSDTFALTVTPVNDAPVVSTPLADQASEEDTAMSFVLPAGAFADVDGDALTLTAALSDGTALPAWLSFDALARSFTGTPPLDFNGVLDVRVTASDGALEVNDTFALTISPANDAAVLSLPPSGEVQVNSHTVDQQIDSTMATLADGGWVVSWTSSGQDGSNNGIYAQRYDVSGIAIGGEVQVNSHTTNSQNSPSIAALADGGWFVGWTSGGQDGSGSGVYGQRYDATGLAVGGEVLINTHTLSQQQSPSVTGLGDGGWVVSWMSLGQDGSSYGINAQRYNVAGTAVGGEVQVNTTTASAQAFSSVSDLSDGGFVVSWTSYSQDGDSGGIYAQRYDVAGTAVGGEVQVNTTTASLQTLSKVAGLSDGGFVVSWTSYVQDGDSGGVYLQRYNAEGIAVGGEVQVNSHTTGNQTSPVVEGLSDGGFVVSWNSLNQDGSSGGIYLQLYDAAGVAVGGEVQVNSHTAGNQSLPSVASIGDGGFAVSWTSYGQDGDGNGIFQKTFDADGSERLGAEYVENGAAVAVAPGLVMTDVDSASLAGATVTVSDYVAGEDVLSFVDQDGISGSWNPVTGSLTLTGAATLASYEVALRSVAYANTSDAPTGTGRTIAFQVDDGGAVDNLSTFVNAQVTIVTVDDPTEIVGIAGVGDFLDATPGDDVFIFKPGFGQDLVTGFQAGVGTDDVLQLEGLGYTNLTDVLEDAQQFGTDTFIEVDASNSITLVGVNMADLHDDDFQFVG